MLEKEKQLTHQLRLREQELNDQYNQSLAAERAAIQAQMRKALDSAEHDRKEFEKTFTEKQAALEAQYREKERQLQANAGKSSEEAEILEKAAIQSSDQGNRASGARETPDRRRA